MAQFIGAVVHLRVKFLDFIFVLDDVLLLSKDLLLLLGYFEVKLVQVRLVVLDILNRQFDGFNFRFLFLLV